VSLGTLRHVLLAEFFSTLHREGDMHLPRMKYMLKDKLEVGNVTHFSSKNNFKTSKDENYWQDLHRRELRWS
jgi:hypothetical protein